MPIEMATGATHIVMTIAGFVLALTTFLLNARHG
jgi:hypothetical protein